MTTTTFEIKQKTKLNAAAAKAGIASLALAVALFAPSISHAQAPEPDPEPAPAQQPRVQPPTPAPIGIVQQGAWTVSPFLGVGFGGNLENSPLNLGLGAAYNWTPRVSFEGELGFARSAEQGIVNRFSSNVTTGSVNVLYHFAHRDTAPYATVGLGFGHAAGDDVLAFDADPSRTALMLNFGGGVKTRVADNVNLRLGLRYFNGNDLVPDFWRPYAGLTFDLGRRQ